MLLTGGVLLALTRGVFLDTWWMRLSLILLLILGVLYVGVKRSLQNLVATERNLGEAPFVKPALWMICGTVAGIVYLMVDKPW